MSALPDFIGIGALKAGTTYIDAVLRSHPDVCMPRDVKEIQFFTRHYARGAEWYGDHFRGCASGKVTGEISPQYMYDAHAAARIAALLPNAKILVSLRDPVARVYSQYKHFVTETGYDRDVPTFLEEHPGAVERSRYWGLLQRYLDVFPREQVDILIFEDLTRQPHKVLPPLYAWLGVDPTFESPVIGTPANVSTRPRHAQAYVAAKRVQTWLTDHGSVRLGAAVKRAGISRLFPASAAEPQAFAAMTPALQSQLAAACAEDVSKLSALLGRDLDTVWTTGHDVR